MEGKTKKRPSKLDVQLGFQWWSIGVIPLVGEMSTLGRQKGIRPPLGDRTLGVLVIINNPSGRLLRFATQD